MVTKQDVIDYYEQCEMDYRLVWGLKKSMAMHYGYWDKTTKSFRQALDRTNEVLAKRVKLKKTDRVLDAGCGVGGVKHLLSREIRMQSGGNNLGRETSKSSNRECEKTRR